MKDQLTALSRSRLRRSLPTLDVCIPSLISLLVIAGQEIAATLPWPPIFTANDLPYFLISVITKSPMGAGLILMIQPIKVGRKVFAFLTSSISLQQFSKKVERVWCGADLVLLWQSYECFCFFVFFWGGGLILSYCVPSCAALVVNAS